MYRLLFVALLISTFPLDLGAQRLRTGMEVDEQGFWQWKSFKKHDCTSGRHSSRRDPCTYCGNAKKVVKDPYKLQPCTQCGTKKTILCCFCFGKKVLIIEGGNPKGNRCFGCKGKGHLKCSLCKGKTWVSAAKIGRTSLKQAKEANLKAARTAIVELGDELQKVTRGSTDAKKADRYTKAVKIVRRYLPAAAGQAKGLKKILKGMAKGQGFTAHAQRINTMISLHTVALARHGTRNLVLIDDALARLKHNAKIQAKIDAENAEE